MKRNFQMLKKNERKNKQMSDTLNKTGLNPAQT